MEEGVVIAGGDLGPQQGDVPGQVPVGQGGDEPAASQNQGTAQEQQPQGLPEGLLPVEDQVGQRGQDPQVDPALPGEDLHHPGERKYPPWVEVSKPERMSQAAKARRSSFQLGERSHRVKRNNPHTSARTRAADPAGMAA